MTSLIYIYILIFIHVISNVHLQGSPGDILGSSACDIFGRLQYFCEIPDVPIEKFPEGCTSYLYIGLEVSKNNTIRDVKETDTGVKGYLETLIKTRINVLIYYTHVNVTGWCAAVQPNNSAGRATEMNNLKAFLDKHPMVKGIILQNLLLIDDASTKCPDYTQNLKSFIDLMRNTFPHLSIGIVIFAKKAKENYKNPKLPWLDFKILDSVVDFYILSFFDLNPCSDEFAKTGIFPLNGNHNNTVDKMRIFLEEAGVSSFKTHYSYSIYGVTKDTNRSLCDAFPTYFCEDIQDAKTAMCIDTLQTLAEKGDYAKKYGAGLVLNTVDIDDAYSNCKCGQPFPGFRALLSGYNGAPPPPSCDLYDRT